MANEQNVWRGVDGNYDTTSNWGLTTKPAATENVVIPEDITQAIVSNADGEDAIDLSSILIQRGHNQDIATSGVPWAISTAELTHRGGGTLYFKAGSTAIPVNKTTINATPVSAGKLSASLTGAAADADAYGNIDIVRGTVDIEAVTFQIARLVIGFIGSQSSDVSVNCKSVDGLITEMHVIGGTVLLNRPVTRLIVTGGEVIIDDFEPTTVHQYGGNVVYMTPATAGTITEYNLGGGTLDLTKSYFAKTVTTLNRFGSPDNQRLLTDRNATITTTNDERLAG